MAKVKRKEIHKELRFAGSLIRTFWKIKTIKRMKRINRFYEKFRKRQKPDPNLVFEEIFVDGLRICIYKPLGEVHDAVGLLWLHGGGYSTGIPESEREYFKRFILNNQCVVIAPDYTRSIDKPFPSAVEDAYKVLKWMKENSLSLGIDDSKLFVGGASAGGGLTAALTLYARDLNEVQIAFQMPLYPMLDYRMITPSSIDNNAPVWNSIANRLAWDIYLDYNYENVSKYASPSIETDYIGLPPTLSFVGGIDLFVDETSTYIENLNQVGIETKFKVFEGCFHAFEAMLTWKKVSKEANRFLLEGFDYACKHYRKEQTK